MATPSTPNAGSVALSKLVAAHGATKELAGKLGVAGYVVSRWASGARRPPPWIRPKIREETGISFEAWESAVLPEAS